MPQRFTSWEAIYRTLRATFPDERYHMGSALLKVDRTGDRVTATIDGVGEVEANLLVCADGAQSPTRRWLLPEVEPQYAGYIAWRGTLDEAVARDLVSFFDVSFTFCEARSGGHILAYLIPGEGAAANLGRRRINWVWYVGVKESDLGRRLTDKNGQRHRSSLAQGTVSECALAELHDLARRGIHPRMAELVAATREPFIQAIQDVIVPRMVFGRTVLLGDAAFVVRPHTAGAAAKAARDATVLATALHRARANVDAGLRSYEEMQVEYGAGLTNYGIALGRRWAAQ